MTTDKTPDMILWEKLNAFLTQLEKNKQITYAYFFLEQTGLRIGDTVMCNFSCSYLKSGKAYTSIRTIEAILMQDPTSDYIYCESKEELPQAISKRNGRSGRSYKSWWEIQMEKRKCLVNDIDLKSLTNKTHEAI